MTPEMPFFSIIIPTYQRKEELERAVASVLNQHYTYFEIIIVNDSPDDERYRTFEEKIHDPKIIYLKNEKNEGVNFSRNRALDARSAHSTWIIFLDDDDYFAEDTLQMFATLIKEHPDAPWLMTNRALQTGESLTKTPHKNDALYSYAWNYLLLKSITGDATHCIRADKAQGIYFPRLIRQAEEWLFFYEIGIYNPLFYHNHNSTISGGYSSVGLNNRPRSMRTQLHTLTLLIKEGLERKLYLYPSFIIYLFMRLLRAFIKN